MSAKPEVAIERLIVHKVDHRRDPRPQLADLESPLSDDVAAFLREHVINNRQHRFTRTAVFCPPTEGEVSLGALADELLADAARFVPSSQEMAWRLYRTADQRVSPGDLVVCTFSDDGRDGAPWLALLKMDPKDGFVGEAEIVDGRVRYVLRRVPNVLPRGELQKAAFILPRQLRQRRGYDLLVLDQQAIRYGARRLVASFFLTDFLQSKVGLTAADRTKSFVYISYAWLAGRPEQWPLEDAVRFQAQVRSSLQADVVDAVAVATAVIPEEEQEGYLDFLRAQGLDELTFAPDPEERQRLTRYAYFEGDYGLQVRIEADALASGALHAEWEPGTNTWVVTIRTGRWERQPR